MTLKLCYFVISVVRLPHALSHHVFWTDALTVLTLAMERLEIPNQIDEETSLLARECLGRIQQVETGTIVQRKDYDEYGHGSIYSYETWGDIDVENTVFSARLLDSLGRLGHVSDNTGIRQTIQSRNPKDINSDGHRTQIEEVVDSTQMVEELGDTSADWHLADPVPPSQYSEGAGLEDSAATSHDFNYCG